MIKVYSTKDSNYEFKKNCVLNYSLKCFIKIPQNANYVHWSTFEYCVFKPLLFAVPDRNTLVTMLQREAELQRSRVAQRAYALPYSDKRAVSARIQLRVVREFGLPDNTVEVMTNSQYYYSEETRFSERRYIPSPARKKHSPVLSLSPSPPYSPTVVRPNIKHKHTLYLITITKLEYYTKIKTTNG